MNVKFKDRKFGAGRLGNEKFNLAKLGVLLAVVTTVIGCTSRLPSAELAAVSTERNRPALATRIAGLTAQLESLAESYRTGAWGPPAMSRRRDGLLASLRSVVSLRADALAEEAVVAPEDALKHVLGDRARQALPAELRACIEHPIQEEGTLRNDETAGYFLEDERGARHLLRFDSPAPQVADGAHVKVVGLVIPCSPTVSIAGLVFTDPISVEKI